MKNTPTIAQVQKSKTWTALFQTMGVNPRNTRVCKNIQSYVRSHYPQTSLAMNKRGYGRLSDEQFADLVAKSRSIRQVIDGGGWKVAGGTYNMISCRIKRQQLSTEHFSGQAHSRGSTGGQKPIEYYLVPNCFSISSHRLKLRLIKEGIKEHRCEVCKTVEWMGKPVPIELDHINGDHHDNRLNNLRIICPNCHAQTPTFSGKKNRQPRPKCSVCDNEVREKRRVTCGSYECLSIHHSRKARANKSKPKKERKSCETCGEEISKGIKYCSYECSHKSRQKIDWSAINITKELETKNFSQLARELGVSDNAIRKQLRKYGGAGGT